MNFIQCKKLKTLALPGKSSTDRILSCTCYGLKCRRRCIKDVKICNLPLKTEPTSAGSIREIWGPGASFCFGGPIFPENVGERGGGGGGKLQKGSKKFSGRT
jgi:hypothetical protein